ncbi:MAG: glycoside hydrolase [Spirochaetota bacterium]
MKLSVIGAGSPRTPLLLQGLVRRNLPVGEVALYDIDRSRLQANTRVIRKIVENASNPFNLVVAETFEQAVDGADFVFSSIRVGQDESRMEDERIALSHGLLPQETVGVGGFSMAMRTIPEAVRQADLIHTYSKKAWIINFSNPSGMVTQAVHSLSSHDRNVGICDAPIMIQKIVGTIYQRPKEDISLQYFGLNHLGWASSICIDGQDIIPDLLENKLDAFVQEEPFYQDLREYMIRTRTIPNEYLYYYLHAGKVTRQMQLAQSTRAMDIAQFNREYYRKLKDPQSDPLEVYNEYMDRREGSYMTKESGIKRKAQPSFDVLSHESVWGYDAVAFDIITAIPHGVKADLVVNIPNNGYCSYLNEDDVIEVSSRYRNGAFRPSRPCPEFPKELTDLLLQVKSFERSTIEASVHPGVRTYSDALRKNPLIPEESAESLAADLWRLHKSS